MITFLFFSAAIQNTAVNTTSRMPSLINTVTMGEEWHAVRGFGTTTRACPRTETVMASRKKSKPRPKSAKRKPPVAAKKKKPAAKKKTTRKKQPAKRVVKNAAPPAPTAAPPSSRMDDATWQVFADEL